MVLFLTPQVGDYVTIVAEDYAGMVGVITKVVRENNRFKYKVSDMMLSAYFTKEEFVINKGE